MDNRELIIFANKNEPPLASLVTSQLVTDVSVNINWCSETYILVDDNKLNTDASVCRFIARSSTTQHLYGSSVLDSVEVDQWISFAIGELQYGSFLEELKYLDKELYTKTYLVGHSITIADILLWSVLYRDSRWKGMSEEKSKYMNVNRWYSFIESQQSIQKVLKVESGVKNSANREINEKQVSKLKRKAEGKFIQLPGAEQGKVVVRFPPEASGYLHIGHAKAVLLNQYYRDTYEGKLIMRFDDTNPAKEKVDFEKVILEDLRLLKVNWDIFSHTSDYFDSMLEYCEQLLKSEDAYVDDTDAESMKQEREQKIESKNRNNTVETNLLMWQEMKMGTEKGQRCCVRAKIDMNSANGCLRDPTIYRCKNEPHPRTNTKYKVYPTYDFACPIVDSLEGVTHCLRTTEYHDRDEQFIWFIKKLGLREPVIWDYSRLNMTHTVLSKRKLTWFIEEGLVDGWDDPRLPTVRGIIRRGLTVDGLKEFIIAQGGSRSVVVMHWDKIWAINKKIIDPITPRYTAVDEFHVVRVNVKNANEQLDKVKLHPKNDDLGEKTVYRASSIIIEQADAQFVKEGQTVTFVSWGNMKIVKIERKGKIVISVDAELCLSDTNYKDTMKVTWLANNVSCYPLIPVICVYFDHIITKAVLGKDEDFKNYVNKNTKSEALMLGEPELRNVKQGDIIQLLRKGFFICDKSYESYSIHSCCQSPIILFYIPDGHTKEVYPANIAKAENVNAVTEISGKSELNLNTKKVSMAETSGSGSVDKVSVLLADITAQGDKVRSLKAAKAEKALITDEVQQLLALKSKYKLLTGEEWTPNIVIKNLADGAATEKITPSKNEKVTVVLNAIVTQGNHVRSLKAAKAEKSVLTEEVQKLLALKSEYKILTGEEWKPDINIESSKESSQSVDLVTEQSSDKTAFLSNAIATQGNHVRSLKAAKADKSVITEEVQKLLALKNEYKTLTGEEWKPDINIESSKESSQSVVRVTEQSSDKTASLSNAIATQGNRVRSLKAAKADKSVITEEVQKLLALKSEYKTLTGEEWKPEHSLRQQQPIGKCSITSNEGDEQPNTTSNLKINDADAIGGGVQKSTVLKTEYAKSAVESKIQKSSVKGEKCVKKKIKEIERIPNIREVSSTANSSALSERYSPDVAQVLDDIQFQCVVLSTLRQSREQTSNELVYEETKKLFALKDKFKELTGHMWTPDYEDLTELLQSSDIRPTTSASTVCPSVNIPDKNGPAREKKTVTSQQSTIPSVKKQTRLGLEVKKEDNLPEWYSQVITKSELIEYYDVSGCYILRPWAYAIWETIQSWFDTEIKKLGVQNCYFPIFVSKGALEREKTHIADFAPEVAWVTKSGDSDLAEPIAIRPTSETVMYPAYAKWIQSYRDLPIKLNQWNNVVRWEFKHPQPFLRTREFLWQEGHTAFATMKEAVDEVYTILDLYAKIYTDLLAIPVVKGRKTEKEKFAGGDFTTTVEAFVAISGRGIQGGTSHHLGQNFSKMFNIIFEDPETKEKAFVYQNSWGITTRTIGVMIMIHADNQGLVLPPRLAAVQVIIVPCGIGVNTTEDESNLIYTSCRDLERDLKSVDIRVKGDYRDNYSPGWKFNHWELKGVPIRIELGPKDIKEERFVIVRRDTGQKISISRQQAIDRVKSILENIHEFLYRKAEKDLQSHIITCHSWPQFTPALDKKNLILAPFCCETSCEDNIKRDSARDEGLEPGAPSMGAKSLCIPFEQPIDGLQDDQKCIHHGCTNVARCYVLFGRSY